MRTASEPGWATTGVAIGGVVLAGEARAAARARRRCRRPGWRTAARRGAREVERQRGVLARGLRRHAAVEVGPAAHPSREPLGERALDAGVVLLEQRGTGSSSAMPSAAASAAASASTTIVAWATALLITLAAMPVPGPPKRMARSQTRREHRLGALDIGLVAADEERAACRRPSRSTPLRIAASTNPAPARRRLGVHGAGVGRADGAGLDDEAAVEARAPARPARRGRSSGRGSESSTVDAGSAAATAAGRRSARRPPRAAGAALADRGRSPRPACRCARVVAASSRAHVSEADRAPTASSRSPAMAPCSYHRRFGYCSTDAAVRDAPGRRLAIAGEWGAPATGQPS